jgi:hypothetical protein
MGGNLLYNTGFTEKLHCKIHCANEKAWIAVINSISPVGNTNQIMGQTRTSGYTRAGIRYLGRLSIPCRTVTPAVSPISTANISCEKTCDQSRLMNSPVNRKSTVKISAQSM